jgi:hypothetical protein
MSAKEIRAAEETVREFTLRKLENRPFTQRLLKLATRLKGGLPQEAARVPETLEAEIDQAIVLVGVEISGDATLEVFGPGSTITGPLPQKMYTAAVLVLAVVMSLVEQAKKEGHTTSQEQGLQVVSALLTGRQNNEVVSTFAQGRRQLLQLIESEHPRARQWLDNVMQLTAYYVIDEKTREAAREKHLFAQALKSLVDAAE